jgi:hypothetical protein
MAQVQHQEKINAPSIRVGNCYVSAKDFIEAVILNTTNETIHFTLHDSIYDAHISFTTTVLRDVKNKKTR